MPCEYVTGDSYHADAGPAQSDKDDRRESRHNVGKLRSKRSLAAIGQSIHDTVTGIFRSSTPQRPIGLPYENFSDHEGGQRIHNAIIFPQRPISVGGGRQSAEHTSGFDRVVRRLSSKRARSRATSSAQVDASSPENGFQKERSPEEQLRSVSMERSYAQSGWHRLKRQISKGSVVKRKRSVNDVGQHTDIEETPGNLKVKRVTLTYPPQFTASEYAHSLEYIVSTIEQQRHQPGDSGPSNTQNTEDVQMADCADVSSSQPTLENIYSLVNRAPSEERQDSYVQATPRNIHSNDATLRALEGRAYYDDGSDWQLNARERGEMAQRLRLLNAHLGEHAPRAGAKEMSVDDADEPQMFNRAQQRRM